MEANTFYVNFFYVFNLKQTLFCNQSRSRVIDAVHACRADRPDEAGQLPARSLDRRTDGRRRRLQGVCHVPRHEVFERVRGPVREARTPHVRIPRRTV